MTVLLFGFGPEWFVIIAALFLLFGASRLPELAKSLGKTRKAFKEGMREAEEESYMEAEQQRQMPQQINPASVVQPQISQMSDEQLLAEMRRRVETKQQ